MLICRMDKRVIGWHQSTAIGNLHDSKESFKDEHVCLITVHSVSLILSESITTAAVLSYDGRSVVAMYCGVFVPYLHCTVSMCLCVFSLQMSPGTLPATQPRKGNSCTFLPEIRI